MAEKLKDPVLPVVFILLLATAAAAVYYWVSYERQVTEPERVQTPAIEPPAEPPIRHPIQRPQAEAAKPLPPLGDSDEAVQDAAAGLIDKATLEKLFNLSYMVRRFVVTVDDLPRAKLSQRYNLAKPVGGEFLLYGKGETLSISADNYRRYAPYVRLAEVIDTKQLVAAYVYFYPLLQEEYRNLGHPKKYFNDRVVEVIDNLLAAPEVKEPVQLIQPKVMYEFADPALAQLSAGQKIMVRMGNDNAARLKAKLKEIRRELVSTH